MKKRMWMLLLAALMVAGTWAQRFNYDKLDRGLVAMKARTGGGVFCSWRLMGDEYYGVKFNVYRDGQKLNEQPLDVSNYSDPTGTADNLYTVAPVVRGVEQAQCKPAAVWDNGYMDIRMDHGSLTSNYIPNDACCADVDGDGELEILLKFDNRSDAENRYMPEGYNGEYAIVEVYKLDGTKLWWLDFGPNMGDFQNNENNIVAYDWDGDGKAEAVMRAADGTVIHAADGNTYTIGDPSKNYRSPNGGGGTNWFMHEGAEYLVYLNGETGVPYQTMEYPLKRLEAGETSLEAAWGDGYGHRSTKHFFGAPYLDGRKPSIFLARGIYTRHKMIALDVDPSTHQLTTRWTWNCSDSSSPWFGNGFHNYGVADVDMDGRDEICFGSMVIDDNGRGLSTTGFGHGDAQHHGDFDPYRPGLEIYTCLEDHPSNAYRDGTTAKVYYRLAGGSDDGRAMCGNFCNDYPGAMGFSGHDTPISCVTDDHITGLNSSGVSLNFRIYWDGDLCDESFNGTATRNSEGAVYKHSRGSIEALTGSLTNNDSKATPCYQGDLFGDWREEIIMRTADNNIRIFSSRYPTTWRNYTLWHDHQYRNAMVWQMCGYNQPPHVSYFLGEMEGITAAPPALTMTGRTEVANGGTIGSEADGLQLITCETNDMTVSVADGATPYIYIDNAPSWVQGTNSNSTVAPVIRYQYYTHTLTGGAFAGDMRLVKQGNGTLVLPNVVQRYTGPTDVWAGKLSFDGTLQNSRLWLNRHTTLVTDGGQFPKGIQAEYNATVIPGDGVKSTLTADSLILCFGSRIVFDLFSEGFGADVVKAKVLTVEKKNWEYGPKYDNPVFQFVLHPAEGEETIADGKYLIGEVGQLEGSLEDIDFEGLDNQKHQLTLEDGKLYIEIENFKAADLTWTGAKGTAWDINTTANFINAAGDSLVFTPNSGVLFNDSALATNIVVTGRVAPSAITFENSQKNFVLSGDSIVGGGELVKNGTGTVTISSQNRIGYTTLNAGKLVVSSLANNTGQDFGSLGNAAQRISIDNGATLSVTATNVTDQLVTIGKGGATLDVTSGTLTLNKSLASGGTAAVLTKTGAGALTLAAGTAVKKVIHRQGNINASGGNIPSLVEFQGGTLYDGASDYSYYDHSSTFYVPDGKTGTYYGAVRGTWSGALTGGGTFNIHATGVRTYFEGDWTAFTGTIVPALTKRGTYDPVFIYRNTGGMPNATLKLNAGVTFNNDGKSMPIGQVSGSGTLAGSGSYILGADGKDFSLGISSTAPIIKEGAGTLTLFTVGKITAPMTVRAGTLRFSQPSLTTLVNGTYMMTVRDSGTVVGQGLVNSMTIMNGGTLRPMAYATSVPGTIKTNALLNVQAGGVVDFAISASKNAQLQVPRLTMNGVVRVTLQDSYTPKEGDEFTLWTVSTSFSGTPLFDLPELPDGLAWDTEGVADKTGVLRIKQSTGIAPIAAHAEVRAEVFTLSGLKVTEFSAVRSQLQSVLRSMPVAGGRYIVRMKADGRTETVKVMK